MHWFFIGILHADYRVAAVGFALSWMEINFNFNWKCTSDILKFWAQKQSLQVNSDEYVGMITELYKAATPLGYRYLWDI